ncbi:hypothetical protein EVAR_16009_1 [Eumeta japonica]|uniref:Uncharacterized protein n=1 Tax=Eumeta variegata TaxID=151549 RepID=A0A4C1W041_EUMVA|nr:hypothetical protein EVAR_16009_1 [Eumeta japonica]
MYVISRSGRSSYKSPVISVACQRLYSAVAAYPLINPVSHRRPDSGGMAAPNEFNSQRKLESGISVCG